MRTHLNSVLVSVILCASGCGTVPFPKKNTTPTVEQPLKTVSFPTQVTSNTELSGARPSIDRVSAEDQITKAIEFLKQGQITQAVVALQEALKLEGDNPIAKDLLTQINQNPNVYFSNKSHFNYTVRAGDTLVTLAQRFLNNPLQFYVLGKLNNIYVAQLQEGIVIKVPGEQPQGDDQDKKLEDALANQVKAKSKETVIKASKAQEIYETAKRNYDEGRYVTVIDILTKPDVEKLKDHLLGELLILSFSRYAKSLEDKKEFVEAQAVLDKATKVMPQSKDLRRQLERINGRRNIEGYTQTAVKLYQDGKPDKAYDLFVKVLNLDSENKTARDHVKLIKAGDIDRFYKEAMQYYRHQELQQAIELWDKVLSIDPGHELARLYRARASELQKRIEKM